jgi:hypothetical protein
MKNILTIKLLCIPVLSLFLFSDCKKQGTYDLFPLKTGNEFYYKYFRYHYDVKHYTTVGTETWKVLSESSQGKSITYTIECRLNAVLKVNDQVIIISDSLRYFVISEKKSSSLLSFSSMLSYSDLSFRRYQNDPQIEIKQESSTSTEGWSYLFRADSGLTKYSYYHPPNRITNETLSLDSLKMFP